MSQIYVESIYGVKTDQPLVQITITDDHEHTAVIQMEPEVAIQQARFIIEAATAALADGFVVGFIKDKIGAPIHAAVEVLGEFRVYRTERKRQFDEHCKAVDAGGVDGNGE